MVEKLDVRGLSCPRPVMLVSEKMHQFKGVELEVLVDTDAAVENIIRLAKREGWKVVTILQQDDEYQLVLMKR
ncbi:MAG: Sulfurtransferase TusA [candidate division WS2 bacterium]|uniref:Sulfurtransferase TusA n=1 Tax=Psychracetigena formicireducens TaxID=2986056 RepID=A0A9E2BHR7_PSYF1|nr:Sulfurtransferase TusA [Candidatus Psychracetigena formicireducens]MBT9151213.1 Sulfurtransferase TusA [Candidatus Psychracetigena formicireducens]